jgi:hypothetical protein
LRPGSPSIFCGAIGSKKIFNNRDGFRAQTMQLPWVALLKNRLDLSHGGQRQAVA